MKKDEAMEQGFARFTIRDLIVFIFIVAILLTILVSLVNKTREEARRQQCQARLKRLSMAIVDFEMSFGNFPAAAPSCINDAWLSTGIDNGNFCQGPNWALNVARSMENHDLEQQVGNCIVANHFQVSDDCSQCGFGDKTPYYLVCPAAQPAKRIHESPVTELEKLSKGNYAANMGAGTYFHSIDGNPYVDDRLRSSGQFDLAKSSRGVMTIGMNPNWEERINQRLKVVPKYRLGTNRAMWIHGHRAGVPEKQVTDGLSKTILLSEVLGFDGSGTVSQDIRGVWVSASMGASTYSHATTPNSSIPDAINGCDVNSPAYLPCTQITNTGPNAGDTFAAARSMHVGGVYSTRADASIGFYANDIDAKVWKALGTRAGGD